MTVRHTYAVLLVLVVLLLSILLILPCSLYEVSLSVIERCMNKPPYLKVANRQLKICSVDQICITLDNNLLEAVRSVVLTK